MPKDIPNSFVCCGIALLWSPVAHARFLFVRCGIALLCFPVARVRSHARPHSLTRPNQVVLREYKHRNLDSLETLAGLWSTYNQGPLPATMDQLGANGAQKDATRDEAAAAATATAEGAGAASSALSLCSASPGAPAGADSGARAVDDPACFSVDVDGDGDGRPDALPRTARVAPAGSGGGDSSGTSGGSTTGSGSTSGSSTGSSNGSSGNGSGGYWSEVAQQLRDADYGAFGRGLGLAADHVNILGHNALVLDVLRIAVGAAHQADCAPLDAQATKAAAKAADQAAKAAKAAAGAAANAAAKPGPLGPDAAAAAAAAAAAECHANRVGERVESDVLRQAASVVI